MNRRERNESGATAVIVAIMAVLLFSLAGLAVDLGNAWARARSVQKQADVSAIGAGSLLPMTVANKGAILAAVADRLNENPAIGQATVTAVQLQDADLTNGHVSFKNDDGSACTDKCTVMSVLPPRAEVDFSFAAVMGFSDTDVQREATVKVESQLPHPTDTMPFWLPAGCSFGSAQPDTSNGNNGPTASATPTTTASPTAPFTPPPSEKGSHTLSGTSPVTVVEGGTSSLSGYRISTLPNKADRASLRFVSPTGVFIEFATQAASSNAAYLDVPNFGIGPSDVTAIPGTWRVFALVETENNKTLYSTNFLEVQVTAASPPASPTAAPTSATPSNVPVGCVGQDRGNFGQLASPRDGYSLQSGFAYNVALGLDHQIVPYVFPSATPENKDCGKNSPSLPGGKFDDTAGAAGNGANCIKGDTGNDGPKIYDGLIAGPGSGVPGRLDTVNGNTTCPSRSNVTIGGKSINNDVLSCFLRGTATLEDIAKETGVDQSWLDPAVTKSPRFVWLPVVYATDRAQKDYQPVKSFVPAFITDEKPGVAATTDNGLQINGNSVKVLTVYTFNPDVLPPEERNPAVDFDPNLGNSVVRLVG